MTTPAISCRDLSVSFGSLDVIKSITFELAAGEIVSLLGPSGSGKSTLLRILAGLQVPMGGSVKVFGADVQGPTSAVRYLVQDYDSFPWLTVRENLALCMNERSDLHISKLLAEVGLDTFSNALPHTLSGGMRKRLGLARALAAQARIILLDEPFASLDVSARNDLYAVLHRVNTLHGSSFIIVTHDVDEAVFISHRVIVGTPRPFIIREIVSTERIRFPRGPTVRLDPAFEQIVTHVRDLLTQTATHPKDI